MASACTCHTCQYPDDFCGCCNEAVKLGGGLTKEMKLRILHPPWLVKLPSTPLGWSFCTDQLWVRNQSQKQVVEQPDRPSIHIARRIIEEVIDEGAGLRINGDGLPLWQEAESQGPIVKPFIASAFPDAYPLTSPCLARVTAGFRDTPE
jgi:hypothetical protein